MYLLRLIENHRILFKVKEAESRSNYFSNTLNSRSVSAATDFDGPYRVAGAPQNLAISGYLVELCHVAIMLCKLCRRCQFMLNWSKLVEEQPSFPLQFCRIDSTSHFHRQ